MEELLGSQAITAAQEKLDDQLKNSLSSLGPHMLGYRGGGKRLDFFNAGKHQLFYASTFIDRDDTTPRFWNAFGFYDGNANATQRIVAEINIPVPASNGIAGFFARDLKSGSVHLMHDGRVGGGKIGVSREAFLAHSRLFTTEVKSIGRERMAIVVAELGQADLIERLTSFVRAVESFKQSLD